MATGHVDYIPSFQGPLSHLEAEAPLDTDADHNRRPPELLPRDEGARAINSEVKEAGSRRRLLDLARACRREIHKRSVYVQQFKELTT